MEANDAASDGAPSPRTIERYRKLASGGWGLIFVEAVAPSREASARKTQLVLNQKNLPEFTRLVDEIKSAAGGAVVIMQLNHAGRYAIDPVAAYPYPALERGAAPRVLTEGEMAGAAGEMAGLVELCEKTGVDGADLKLCHGYFNIELARPANTRYDKFGGSFENRTRFLKAMIDAARPFMTSSGSFLGGSRISLFEGVPGGLGDDKPEDAPLCDDVEKIIASLEDAGCSWICETAGNPYFNPDMSRPNKNDDRRFETAALHHRLAARVKKPHPSLAVIGAGYTVYGAEFAGFAEKNISDGNVDFIGFGRQNFADPELPKKLRNGDVSAVKWCKLCPEKSCSWLLRNGAEAGCIIHDRYYREILKKVTVHEVYKK